jgi:hypothetical protein
MVFEEHMHVGQIRCLILVTTSSRNFELYFWKLFVIQYTRKEKCLFFKVTWGGEINWWGKMKEWSGNRIVERERRINRERRSGWLLNKRLKPDVEVREGPPDWTVNRVRVWGVRVEELIKWGRESQSLRAGVSTNGSVQSFHPLLQTPMFYSPPFQRVCVCASGEIPPRVEIKKVDTWALSTEGGRSGSFTNQQIWWAQRRPNEFDIQIYHLSTKILLEGPQRKSIVSFQWNFSLDCTN